MMMKKNRVTISLKEIQVFLMLSLLVLLTTSCNEDFPNELQENYPEELEYSANSKILHIIIDGVSGEAVRETTPENIFRLSENSIYTFNGLVDSQSDSLTIATAWANLLTGVGKNRHQVDSLEESENDLGQYPSYITRIEQTKPELNTYGFASSSEFGALFLQDADEAETFDNNGSQVTEAVKNVLNEGDPDVIVAEYNEALRAGMTEGFVVENSNYRNAISNIDGQIGEIMEALRSRPGYGRENWMVVITSSNGEVSTGGEAEDVFDDRRRNTFSLLYNSRFRTRLIQEPVLSDVRYTGYGVRYTYDDDNVVTAVLKDSLLYNIDEDTGYTIQFLTKVQPGNYGFPAILSKRASDFNGPGWNLFLEGDYWVLNTSMSGQLYGTTISNNEWHSITVVFDREPEVKSNIRIFTDGILNAESVRDYSSDEMANRAPLRIGRNTNGDNKPELLLKNLQIYDIIIPDNQIADLACRTVIDQSHPYYNDLIGYWPGNDEGSSVLEEQTNTYGDSADFAIQGPYTWVEYNDLNPNVCPPIPETYFNLVPNSVDIPVQIFQWLGLGKDEQWQWEGHGWVPIYTTE